MENMRSRGRGRRGRGRGRGAAGRRKKSIDRKEDLLPAEEEDEEEIQTPVPVIETHNPVQVPPPLDMEADISQLEAPTFTTLSRGPPEPMLRLRWGHPVNLLGEKVLNPMIHCCDTCLRPVLIYGRMIPCKHVFCLACAQRDCKQCPRCNDKVVRVEQTGLGTVFMCTHGGTRYGNTGCRRTYLSQRDLQAHINHRHVTGPGTLVNPIPVQCNKIPEKLETRLPAGGGGSSTFFEAPKVKLFEEPDLNYVQPRVTTEQPAVGPPPMVRMPAPRAGNLITVPIQEPPPEPYFNAFNPPPVVSHIPPPIAHGPPPTQPPPPYYPPFDYPPPDTSVPPPNQWPGNPPFYS